MLLRGPRQQPADLRQGRGARAHRRCARGQSRFVHELLQGVALAVCAGLVVEVPRRNDLPLHLELPARAGPQPAVQSRGRHEADDKHRPLLANAVCAVHGLGVHLRVPVRVEEDDGVGNLQVKAQAPCPGCKQQDSELRLHAEDVHGLPPPAASHAAVNALVAQLVPRKKLLQQVQRGRHLCKDEDLVAKAAQPREHPVQELELAGCTNQVLLLACDNGLTLEEMVRVVQGLAQPHYGGRHRAVVTHLFLVCGEPVHSPQAAEVEGPLPRAERHPDDHLMFLGKVGKDHGLCPAQQEGPQHAVQSLDDQHLLLLREHLGKVLWCFLRRFCSGVVNAEPHGGWRRQRKPHVKLVERAECLGSHEG
mmetsp:Transcript_9937/g.30938  ORF Transcript_9937/g.30938 Transcript_9937/m.30938 type:complete len:364 (+) Transcript_9937:471-1562(+)